MEEKKVNSTNKLLIILVVLLSLLVGGFGGYIVFSHISKNDSNNFNKIEGEAVEEEKSDVVKELSIENEFVQKMFNMHRNYILGVGLINHFYSKDTMLISDLSDDAKRNLFLNYNLLYLEPDNKDDNHIYYNSDRVKKEWNKLFGSSVVFPFKADLDEYGIGFTDDGSYKYCRNCGIGDLGPLGTINMLLRATKSDDEIVLYESVKFVDLGENDTAIYYKDYEKTIKITSDETIDANYKFIYKYDKEINNYYFYAVEKIK